MASEFAQFTGELPGNVRLGLSRVLRWRGLKLHFGRRRRCLPRRYGRTDASRLNRCRPPLPFVALRLPPPSSAVNSRARSSTVAELVSHQYTKWRTSNCASLRSSTRSAIIMLPRGANYFIRVIFLSFI
jgi:hypothetical protein